jgi:hypothetical protein
LDGRRNVFGQQEASVVCGSCTKRPRMSLERQAMTCICLLIIRRRSVLRMASRRKWNPFSFPQYERIFVSNLSGGNFASGQGGETKRHSSGYLTGFGRDKVAFQFEDLLHGGSIQISLHLGARQ